MDVDFLMLKLTRDGVVGVMARFLKWIGSISSSLLISLLALLVSFGQLLASVPLLTDFYNKPKLVIEGSSSRARDPMSIGTYRLENNGRSPATNVEVGFNTRIGDRVVVMPAVAHKVITDKEPLIIDHARLEFSRVLPGEFIMIMVTGKGDEPLPDAVVKSLEGTDFDMYPSVSYLRSDQGSGAVIQKPNSEGQPSPTAK